MLDKTRELLKVQAGFGGLYNSNLAKPMLSEVSREHGQAVVNQLKRELELEKVFGFETRDTLRGRACQEIRNLTTWEDL